MSDAKSAIRTGARRLHGGSRVQEDGGVPLLEVSLGRWEQLPDRQSYLLEINTAFHDYLNELITAANACVDGYEKYWHRHEHWRKTVIISTGTVAALNLLATNRWKPDWLATGMSMLAALAAVALTVLANLESFGNSLDQAYALREAREFFLDASREFDRLWNTHVIPLGESAEACANAAELYRRIVIADSELRGRLKELTKTQKKPQKP
jgi:hypothetical protein